MIMLNNYSGQLLYPRASSCMMFLLSTINIVINELKGGLLGMLVGNACKECLNESHTLTCLLVNVIVVSIV